MLIFDTPLPADFYGQETCKGRKYPKSITKSTEWMIMTKAPESGFMSGRAAERSGCFSSAKYKAVASRGLNCPLQIETDLMFAILYLHKKPFAVSAGIAAVEMFLFDNNY